MIECSGLEKVTGLAKTMMRDFHIHATAYREGNPAPDNTVAAVLAKAAELGLQYVGVGEHLNRSPNHPAACLHALVAEFRSLPPNGTTMKAFVGAEADILDQDGTVTCTAAQKRAFGLDYLLAAVHTNPASQPDVTRYVDDEHQRILGVIRRCAHVDVIAHPWGQGVRWERAGAIRRWSFDLVPDAYKDSIIAAAVRHDKAIEVNLGGKTRVDDQGYVAFVCELRDSGVKISIGSDAHAVASIARGLDTYAFLQGLGIHESQLWHAGSA